MTSVCFPVHKDPSENGLQQKERTCSPWEDAPLFRREIKIILTELPP